MSAIRVLVADDDTLLREGVASVLEKAGFEVVGRAGDATALLELVRTESPNLVVVDIRMPPTHTTEGLEAAQKIRGEHPGIGVLVLSAHVEVEYAAELITSGDGVGYLLKSRIGDVGEFADACTRVAGGGSIVDPELVRELLSARRKDDPLSALSQRELEVLELMAQGLSIPESLGGCGLPRAPSKNMSTASCADWTWDTPTSITVGYSRYWRFSPIGESRIRREPRC